MYIPPSWPWGFIKKKKIIMDPEVGLNFLSYRSLYLVAAVVAMKFYLLEIPWACGLIPDTWGESEV